MGCLGNRNAGPVKCNSGFGGAPRSPCFILSVSILVPPRGVSGPVANLVPRSGESIRLAGSHTDSPSIARVKTQVLPDLVSRRTAVSPAGETMNWSLAGGCFPPGCCAWVKPQAPATRIATTVKPITKRRSMMRSVKERDLWIAGERKRIICRAACKTFMPRETGMAAPVSSSVGPGAAAEFPSYFLFPLLKFMESPPQLISRSLAAGMSWRVRTGRSKISVAGGPAPSGSMTLVPTLFFSPVHWAMTMTWTATSPFDSNEIPVAAIARL